MLNPLLQRHQPRTAVLLPFPEFCGSIDRPHVSRPSSVVGFTLKSTADTSLKTSKGFGARLTSSWHQQRRISRATSTTSATSGPARLSALLLLPETSNSASTDLYLLLASVSLSLHCPLSESSLQGSATSWLMSPATTANFPRVVVALRPRWPQLKRSAGICSNSSCSV